MSAKSVVMSFVSSIAVMSVLAKGLAQDKATVTQSPATNTATKATPIPTPSSTTAPDVGVRDAVKNDVLRIDFNNSDPSNQRQISCSCKVMAGNSVYKWITVSCKGPSAKDCETCCDTLSCPVFDSKPST